jgi:hypothetical protein
MFNRLKKKEDKDFEFKIRMIEEIGTLKTQNEFLYERLKKLEIELAQHIDGGHNHGN